MELQIAPMHRLIRKAGADRVSEDAAEEMRRTLEEVALRIAREAAVLAGHAGRKTVRAEDIRLAARGVMRG
ncbi:MAG: NFYB/HAP3 family transcription factor subunit [Candidatus Bathyarchaeia archaeon]